MLRSAHKTRLEARTTSLLRFLSADWRISLTASESGVHYKPLVA